MKIEIAQEREIGTVLALIEELLAELGEEGQEFAGIDREKLHADIRRNMAVRPDSGPDSGHGSGRFLALLAKEESGAVIGVLTLSTSFALYAGGEYGVIDEMYVRPEYRCRGVGRQLVDAAVAIARREEMVPPGRHRPRGRARRARGPLLREAGVRVQRAEAATVGVTAASTGGSRLSGGARVFGSLPYLPMISIAFRGQARTQSPHPLQGEGSVIGVS